MELLEFWEEISLVPDAVRQIEKLEITEGEYEKLRELFLRDVNLFYEAVKKREDFRLVFLYCFSKMACEVYDRYCEQGISRRVYRDTFYDLTLWCENCYKAYGEYGIAQYDWFCRHLDMSLFRLGRLVKLSFAHFKLYVQLHHDMQDPLFIEIIGYRFKPEFFIKPDCIFLCIHDNFLTFHVFFDRL